MAELLSREKEFIKLNQELDKLATANVELKQKQATSGNTDGGTTLGSGGGSAARATTLERTRQEQQQQQRFLTYTKAKGVHPVVKKRGVGGTSGAGDGGADTLNDLPTDRPGYRTVRHNKPMQHSPTSAATHARTDDDAVGSTATHDTPKQARNSGNVANSGTYRKNLKSPETSRTHNRNSNSRVPTNTPFTVRYRNPKFVQSPSLEVLLKDESATLRNPADCESVRSSATVAMGGNVILGNTTTRRSSDLISKKQINSDSLIKFLKSKISILEEDHDRISQEMTAQKDLLEKTLERNKKMEQQRDQAYMKHNAIAEQLAKTESQLEEANRRVKERSVEHLSQQKELEVARRELKVLTQTNTNLEKRLYRATEELENTKNALTLLKNTEREMKETMRLDGDAKDKQIKSLKKQRADLLNAYKKQLFLIDNLKRQNICMEQTKMISFGEKDFSKVLDWNAKT